MKTVFTCAFLLASSLSYCQKGDELLVYSLKGNVTVIENNKESRLKIGKVLKAGSTVKTQREAKLTMVCKQGKPISVTKEGSFPVATWMDSCTTGQHGSVTSKYFSYIWDQLYVRSDDYKREHPEGTSAVADAPVRGQEELEIFFNEGMDSVNYATGNFPLSWMPGARYSGNYYFTLFAVKGNKLVYKDSIAGTVISLEKLKKYMRPGNSYSWSLTTPKTGVVNGGIIKYVPLKTVTGHIAKLQRSVNVPEDEGSLYFRLGYMLENSHYPAEAYTYYSKAVKAAPDVEFYREKLDEFKKNFQIATD